MKKFQNDYYLLEKFKGFEVNTLKAFSEYTSLNYRPHSESKFQYIKLCKMKLEDKFNEDGFRGVYNVLKLWNMNSRAARLKDFSEFRNSLFQNKKEIFELNNLKLVNLTEHEFQNIIKKIEYLYDNLTLTKANCKTVTFSKALHFILPELIVPIDRKFTQAFFKLSNPEFQYGGFEVFRYFFTNFWNFTKKYNLIVLRDSNWNTFETKIMDNIIIGYHLKHGQRKENN